MGSAGLGERHSRDICGAVTPLRGSFRAKPDCERMPAEKPALLLRRRHRSSFCLRSKGPRVFPGRAWLVEEAAGTSVAILSTNVPFLKWASQSTFAIEQFWGRAARASRDSNRVETPVLFLERSPAAVHWRVRFEIEKLVYGGDGLARLPSDEQGRGKSVFIPFVLGGEQVEAAVTEEKPGFARARLESVLQASPDRITPGCPYFQRCGGCHYQHADYSNQLKIKAAILRETLERTAKLEIPCQLEIHPSPEWNYRNRTRLKVEATPHFALGYYGFRSHDLLPVERCPISSPLINRAIETLWQWAAHAEVSSHMREVEFFTNHSDDRLLLEVYCGPGTPRRAARELAESLAAMLGEVSGVTVFAPAKPGSFTPPKRLAQSGEAQLTYKAELADYKVGASSFFQVNRFQIDELVKIVTENVSGKIAVDLYAGVGLFSVVLARSFQQVIAVEVSQDSLADLRDNAPREVKAVSATTEQFLRQASGLRPDLVVADPPRAGLGEGVVGALAQLGPPRITYVSCDPSTLARDLRTFGGLGYRIVGAHLVDLFPQTFHIESVFHLAAD